MRIETQLQNKKNIAYKEKNENNKIISRVVKIILIRALTTCDKVCQLIFTA